MLSIPKKVEVVFSDLRTPQSEFKQIIVPICSLISNPNKKLFAILFLLGSSGENSIKAETFVL